MLAKGKKIPVIHFSAVKKVTKYFKARTIREKILKLEIANLKLFIRLAYAGTDCEGNETE